MRVMHRCRDESGVTAVLLAILLVVVIAILAFAIDGGLLLSKYRQVRRAADAGSLAAAISCARQETTSAGGPTASATASASQYTASNVVDPSEPAASAPTVTFKDKDDNVVASCEGLAAGKVTVRYTVPQSLMFGPAVGVSSPKDVSAEATAAWGAASAVGGLIPLTLAEGNELRVCTPGPSGPPVVDAQCKLFWDGNDAPNGKWGIIDMREQYWHLNNSASGCNSNGSSNLVNGNPNQNNGWMIGVSGSWFTATPNSPNAYVWACAADGGQGNSLTSAVNSKAAYPAQDVVYMPVFRPSATVYASDGAYKYAIVGFAGLRVIRAYQGNEAAEQCGIVPPDTKATGYGNSRCLIASWQGFQTGGLDLGGVDFGVRAVALTA